VEGRPLDESELVKAARRGDSVAYAELVRRYQDVAFRVAYMTTRSAADAADAAQEAFVKAYYALPRFRAEAPLRPWLLRIVVNEARNRRRSARRRERLTLRVAADPASGDAAPSPEAGVLAGERRAEVLAAVSELKERDRQVIVYRYFLSLSETEMAEILGVAPGTVKSRLSRALARLRPLVAKRGLRIDREVEL
jgi:RNA polymerase sigma-70 factor (ECF subfamily)